MADHHTPTPDGSGPAYRTAGPEDGDPLVLLTAPQDTAGDWAPVRDALARGRRIHAPDLSGPTGGGRPAPLVRDDLLGFLDALGLDRVDLVGHATGALVALLAAQAAPHRVVGLVLADLPPALPREPPAAPGRITAPTLVVNGAADAAGQVPDARMLAIAADGRPVHQAAPAEFATAVEAFLDEVPDSELARRWLAGSGITQTGESAWWDADPPACSLTAGVGRGPGPVTAADPGRRGPTGAGQARRRRIVRIWKGRRVRATEPSAAGDATAVPARGRSNRSLSTASAIGKPAVRVAVARPPRDS